jgi:hypothetical protein
MVPVHTFRMPDHCRYRVPDDAFSFTVNLLGRRPDLAGRIDALPRHTDERRQNCSGGMRFAFPPYTRFHSSRLDR